MPFGLTLKPDDPLCSLILKIPDYNFNPVGAKARKTLVNKLEEVLPGTCKDPYLIKAIPFRKIFYPHYAEVELQKMVTKVTALSDEFWADFSISVLCQSIYCQTSEAKNGLDIGKIESSITDSNKLLLSKALTWYVYVLFHDFMQFSGSTSSAKKIYMEQINNLMWINYKMKSYASGSWENPEWEMYHHFAKLTALGATVTEVNDLICLLQRKGLKIPDNVTAVNWTSYLVWCRPSEITHKDIDNTAECGVLKMASIANPYGLSNLVENFSFDFISAGQPGSKYCKSTNLMSYIGDTQVLMANYSLKAIQEIKVGDLLMTPQGERKVLLVSTRTRKKCDLYGINGLSFHFTATHPIISGTITPKVIAILPLDILSNIPLIGQNGIGLLEIGSVVMGYDLHYKKIHSVEVTSVEKIPASDKEDELLYDLIPEPDSSGVFEYIVGSKDSLFVTASEVSTIDNYTSFESLAFDVVVGMITQAASELEELYKSTDDVTFSSLLCSFSRKLMAFLPISAVHLKYDTQNGKLPESRPLNDRIVSAARSLNSKDHTFNFAICSSYNHFMYRMYAQLCSILTLGYRIFSVEVKVDSLAIGIFDFQVTSSSLRIPPDPTIIVHAGPVTAKMKTLADKILLFGKKIYRTIFIPVNKMKADDDSLIKIEICEPESDKILLTATFGLGDYLSQVSKYRHLRLHDQNNIELGYINIDLRLLPGDQEKREEKLTKTYCMRKQIHLANHLQNDAGSYLASLCEAYTVKNGIKVTDTENKDDSSQVLNQTIAQKTNPVKQ